MSFCTDYFLLVFSDYLEHFQQSEKLTKKKKKKKKKKMMLNDGDLMAHMMAHSHTQTSEKGVRNKGFLQRGWVRILKQF